MIIEVAAYSLENKKLIIRLFKNGMEYGISCAQIGYFGITEDKLYIENITPNKSLANKIFMRIVKYKAFSCSICEIIEDMIC